MNIDKRLLKDLLPENPTRFDYLHAIRALASRLSLKEFFDLADAGMNTGDNKWQLIDTAPKSAKSVLVYCAEFNNIYTAENGSGKWIHFGSSVDLTEEPTMWMPIPQYEK